MDLLFHEQGLYCSRFYIHPILLFGSAFEKSPGLPPRHGTKSRGVVMILTSKKGRRGEEKNCKKRFFPSSSAYIKNYMKGLKNDLTDDVITGRLSSNKNLF